MLYGITFSAWEKIIKFSLWIAGIAGIIAASSAFISGYFGYQLSDKIQKISDERIAEAQREAALGNENAALANQRAVMLENEANHAKLELERLRSVVAWRTLDATTSDLMALALTRGHGSLTIAYVQNDPEALSFAIQIEHIFVRANTILGYKAWTILIDPRLTTSKLYFDIYISGRNTEIVKCVRDAFSDRHIPFSTDDTPNEGVQVGNLSMGPSPLTTDALIMVGSKKPAITLPDVQGSR